jgi:hypothetical protein
MLMIGVVDSTMTPDRWVSGSYPVAVRDAQFSQWRLMKEVPSEKEDADDEIDIFKWPARDDQRCWRDSGLG